MANEARARVLRQIVSFVFDGQTCPYHHHRMKHETFFHSSKVPLRMKVGEEERLMREGHLLAMPPGVGHSFTGVGPPASYPVQLSTALLILFRTTSSLINGSARME